MGRPGGWGPHVGGGGWSATHACGARAREARAALGHARRVRAGPGRGARYWASHAGAGSPRRGARRWARSAARAGVELGRGEVGPTQAERGRERKLGFFVVFSILLFSLPFYSYSNLNILFEPKIQIYLMSLN
jgi:hypothetical protein